MSNLNGLPTASIIPTIRKGDHEYATLQLRQPETPAERNSVTTTIDNSTILCAYDIPFHISIPEFLEFVAPVDPFVSQYRVIRDSSPSSYMVLLKMRDPYSANDFYKQYNGRLFSSMEEEKCQVVYIDSVEVNSLTLPSYAIPFLNQSTTAADEEDLLPTCPVCLEAMDESATGLLTILCQHTFHCHCLSKWGDGSCPVCRYSQKPIATDTDTTVHKAPPAQRIIGDENDNSECAVCKSKENLWVCLICGNIGCGRYVGAHAHDHYKETSHLYSLEIDTQRVWDYAGDGYVHRLIQNVVDGKLVEMPSNADSTNEQSASQEKMEAISLEYSYLLTSQLESQRIYYENQLDELSHQISNLSMQVKSLKGNVNSIISENNKIEAENTTKETLISDISKGKEKAEKKLEAWKEKCESTKSVWLEEKEMTNSLLQNNGLLLKSMEDREKAIKELSDQVRDLMFFLEAREKVQGHPELEGGNIETHTPQQPKNSRRKGKR